MSDLNASVGIDFSLLGANLHAAYEKKGKEGYAVLLLPTEHAADHGVSIGQVIEDIKSLVKGVDDGTDTEGMEKDLESGVASLSVEGSGDGSPDPLKKLIVKLQMAYLYIYKTETESVLEYAFQLQVIAKGMIPQEITNLVDVDNVSISVWNTSRKQILDRMSLVTIDEYIGIPQKNREGQHGAE